MWTIEYDNDTGDEGFCQRWTITDGQRFFRCDTQKGRSVVAGDVKFSNP